MQGLGSVEEMWKAYLMQMRHRMREGGHILGPSFFVFGWYSLVFFRAWECSSSSSSSLRGVFFSFLFIIDLLCPFSGFRSSSRGNKEAAS